MENRALIGSGAEMAELLEFMKYKHNHKKYNIRVLYNKCCCSNGATGDPSHQNHILINLLSNKRVGDKDVDPLGNRQTPKRKKKHTNNSAKQN